MSLQIDNYEITLGEDYTTFKDLDSGKELRIATDKLASFYFHEVAADTGLLPPVVRYISPNFRSFIVERSPERKNITVLTGKKGEVQEFALPLPWLVYVLRFEDVKLSKLRQLVVYGRNSQIYHENSNLYTIGLPGLLPDSSVANINWKTGLKLASAEVSSAEIIGAHIDAFWNRVFAFDDVKWMNAIPEGVQADVGKTDAETAFNKLNEWAQLSCPEFVELQMQQAEMFVKDQQTPATLKNWVDKLLVEDGGQEEIELDETSFGPYMFNLIQSALNENKDRA